MQLQSTSFLDRASARVLAGVIALAALAALAQVWLTTSRMDATGRALPTNPAALTDPSGNEAFNACKSERTADIDRMLSDGLITSAQRDEFREKAIATCAGQFPTGKGL